MTKYNNYKIIYKIYNKKNNKLSNNNSNNSKNNRDRIMNKYKYYKTKYKI